MTAHASRLPVGLAPLIAEAKQRMRRRRSLAVLVVALAGLGVGLAVAARSPSAGPGVQFATSVRAGALRVSVPEGFSRYALRGGLYRKGTRPPVIGYLITNRPLAAGVENAWSVWPQWFGQGRSGPPADRVVLRVAVWWGFGPISDRLHLPLGAKEQWSEYTAGHGSVPAHAGFLRFRNADYDITYWIGPAAGDHDRAAILRALESIRPAR